MKRHWRCQTRCISRCLQQSLGGCHGTLPSARSDSEAVTAARIRFIPHIILNHADTGERKVCAASSPCQLSLLIFCRPKCTQHASVYSCYTETECCPHRCLVTQCSRTVNPCGIHARVSPAACATRLQATAGNRVSSHPAVGCHLTTANKI